MSNDPRNRPLSSMPYAAQPQPHMRNQYGPPQGEQQRRPSGLNPPQGYQGGQMNPPQGYQGGQMNPPQGYQGGQMNRPQSMSFQHDQQFQNSALTFNGSSQSLMSNGPQLTARKPTIRHIPLTPEGNLVVDVPVPDRVLANAKYQSGDEFTYTRYTAVTSTADQFPHSGYTLRQQEMQRSTELFIVVTMYLFQIKCLGIMKRMICSASRCLL